MGIYDVTRFWLQTGACAVGVYMYQALLPRREGPGDEASVIGHPLLHNYPYSAHPATWKMGVVQGKWAWSKFFARALHAIIPHASFKIKS